MPNCIIIDDEPLARELLKEYLRKFPEIQVIQECNDGFEGLKAIQTLNLDLIFLDIQMPKINGFELLELVDKDISVIFTTAFDEYAMKAFEANAIDYLLKPFSQERFNKAIQKWKDFKPKHDANTQQLLDERNTVSELQNRVVVKEGSQIKILNLDEVTHLEAFDDYVKIFTEDNCFLKKKTMTFFENNLPKNQFVRVHRSFILNIQYLLKIELLEKENYQAKLKTGQNISLSRAGYTNLKKTLGI